MIRTIDADDERQARFGLRAVIVEDGGSAAEAGTEARSLVDRCGERAEAGIEAAGARGVEAGVGNDQIAGGRAAARDIDHLGGERAADGVGAVERGDREIAGVEESRREVVELAQPPRERVGGFRDTGSGSAELLLQRVGPLGAFGEAAAERVRASLQFAEPPREPFSPAAEGPQAAAQGSRLFGQARRAAAEALSPSVEPAETRLQPPCLSAEPSEFFAIGGEDGCEQSASRAAAREGWIGGGGGSKPGGKAAGASQALSGEVGKQSAEAE